MKILLSGSSGLIGAELLRVFREKGHSMVLISREHLKNPTAVSLEKWEGVDAVIHLAGEPVASGLWTKKKREKIYKSRVEGTQNLVASLQKLKQGPKVFISASAMGYYGEGVELKEGSPSGATFLSQVCIDWEKASFPLKEQKNIRVIHLRLAHVLSKRGGSLKPLVIMTKAFLGAILGSGDQKMSWIGLHDLTRAVEWLIEHEHLNGPFNCASPDSTTQRKFMKTLEQVLNRPIFLRIPAFFLHVLLGKMADELFLKSLEILPKNLLDSGFEFQEQELDKALRLELDA